MKTFDNTIGLSGCAVFLCIFVFICVRFYRAMLAVMPQYVVRPSVCMLRSGTFLTQSEILRK